MAEHQQHHHEPTIAPGQELTLHPGDPVRGAELLDDQPETREEGNLTLVAVFEDMTGAHSCANDLERRGWGVEVTLLDRRADGPEQGTQPGNIITGRGYGLSAENQSPPRNAPMGSGVAVGATLGATVGWLAANYVIPGIAPLAATGGLISTLVGGGLGAFLGGLSQYSVADHQDDATLYAGQVRRGGVILLARLLDEDADRVRRAIEFWEPLEIRVQ